MGLNPVRIVAASCAVLIVVGTASAGWPFHKHHQGDCGCRSASVAVAAVSVVHAAPVADCGCACAAVAGSCCGIGGGVSHLGNVYGLGVHADQAIVSHSLVGAATVGGSGLTGYEGLPNMDGGGINHRYPYHSYRRPWAFPGPPSTNISIVW